MDLNFKSRKFRARRLNAQCRWSTLDWAAIQGPLNLLALDQARIPQGVTLQTENRTPVGLQACDLDTAPTLQ